MLPLTLTMAFFSGRSSLVLTIIVMVVWLVAETVFISIVGDVRRKMRIVKTVIARKLDILTSDLESGFRYIYGVR